MADWVTISSLATAGGTLVLAAATFASVRSANRAAPDSFRRLTRDLYIAPNDIGFWQGVYRDLTEPEVDDVVARIKGRERIIVDVLYGDHRGSQRVISRYSLQPRGDGGWLATVARHWNVDRPDPR